MKKYKLAILTAHPIQYQAPLFKKLAKQPEIDLTVYFCWDFGVDRPGYDSGFGKEIKWDIPLLDGYKYKFLKNYSLKPSESFFGQINFGIIKELFQHRYDAIWIHGYASFTNWLAFFGAKISRTPILLRGESHLLTPRPVWRKAVKNILLRLLFKNISGFLVIGSLNKDYYKYYGVSQNKIFLVPYAVDDCFFKNQYKKWKSLNNEIRKELGVKKGEIIILYVGKIFGAKGPGAFDLLKAFEKLSSNSQSMAKLVFVGDGKEKPLLEQYVADNNIRNVIFAGFKNQTELPKYYSVADTLVLPSYSEQWGLVVNEAMYFGNAIIASKQVGAVYDLVRYGKNGYIFSAGDVAALTEIIYNLINNGNLLKVMQDNSLKIIDKWGLDSCVNGVLTALRYIKNLDNKY